MPINYQKLIDWRIPEVEQHLTRRDTMLYALGVGLGADPCDASQLKFVFEQNLEALPTMAIVLGYAGPWYGHQPEIGIARSHVVHGEQGIRIVKPLPVEGDLVGKRGRSPFPNPSTPLSSAALALVPKKVCVPFIRSLPGKACWSMRARG